MDLSIRQLRAFLAVAEARNFSAAAAELRTAQSNLSRIVVELEHIAGRRLLIRTTRSVSLTEAGAALVDAARRVIEVHEHEMGRFLGAIHGEIGTARVAALPSVSLAVLPEFFERMLAEHPGVQVELREGATNEIATLLRGNKVHLGIGLQPDDAEHIRSERFISDHFVAVMSENSVLAHRSEVTWSQLAEMPFIALSTETSVRQLTDVTFQRLGIEPRESVRVANTASVAGMVARGLGVSALPALALGLFDYPGLVRLPLTQPSVKRDLRILRRRDLSATRVGSDALAVLRALRDEHAPLPVGAMWTAEGPDDANVE